MSKSALARAIRSGLAPGGSLEDELAELGEVSVHAAADARAVVEGLEAAVAAGRGEDVYELAVLFQQVEDPLAPAFGVLQRDGVPVLIEAYEGLKRAGTEGLDAALFVLKILAMFGTAEGATCVIAAAREPLAPESIMWSVILGSVGADHPEASRIFESLANPLPEGFLGVALLDAANAALLENLAARHPFDSELGHERLAAYLADPDPDHYSYARSATGALPYLAESARGPLLGAALAHPDGDVQLEAAWAAARAGAPEGKLALALACRDVNRSLRARELLEELGFADAVPAEAHTPEFHARAELAAWLAHPNELGRAPDSVEVVDHRVLAWPPSSELRPMWLLRYRVADTTGLADDDVGVGCVGSVTFCLFGSQVEDRPPEDAYALYAYWEMAQAELIDESEVDAADPVPPELFEDWSGPALESPAMVARVRLAPGLGLPAKIVAQVRAIKDKEPGWVVFDGPRTRWYPATDFPDQLLEASVLSIHVGRQLLGFPLEADRTRPKKPVPQPRSPEVVLAAYEKLLERAETGPDADRRALLCEPGPLPQHFAAYVNARAARDGRPAHLVACDLYDRLLAAAATAPPGPRSPYDMAAPLGLLFDANVEAALATGRPARLVPAVEALEPHWDHNLGYTRLGTAAYRCGLQEAAERNLSKLREGYDDWPRMHEMSLLADLWHRQGRHGDAKSLLTDALRALVAEERSALPADKPQYEEAFQVHRGTFVRLYGEPAFAATGVPSKLPGA